MFEQLQPHDHAVLVYEEQATLQRALADFLREGLRAGQLVVFVHAFEETTALDAFLAAADVDHKGLLNQSFFLVSFFREAFETDRRRIDFDHAASVVGSIIDKATQSERQGVRILVDASRAYLHAGRDEEWFQFEHRLGRRLHQAVALVCAYDRATIDTAHRQEQVLLTHAYRFEQ